MKNIENFDEISNLCESSKEELEMDDFKNSEEKIKNFKENLLPKANEHEEGEHNTFMTAILYTIRYEKSNKTNICNKNEFKEIIEKKLVDKLGENKFKLEIYLNLDKW